MDKRINTQSQKLDYLIKKFKEDSLEYSAIEAGDTVEEKKNVLRSLMNVRLPKIMDEHTISIQDDFLQEDIKEKGIVKLSDIPIIKVNNTNNHEFVKIISIWKGDITRLQVGAIVNAANQYLLGCFVPCHRCIDNAIHSAAGIQLRNECNHIMNKRKMRYGKQYVEPTGTATLTAAYNLPCDYVIHTVGPIVYGEMYDSLQQDLSKCYESILDCCLENNIRSVAFCCISTGEFHFPNNEAAKIATETVNKYLMKYQEKFDRIIFNVFKDKDKQIYEELYDCIE